MMGQRACRPPRTQSAQVGGRGLKSRPPCCPSCKEPKKKESMAAKARSARPPRPPWCLLLGATKRAQKVTLELASAHSTRPTLVSFLNA